MSKNKKAKKKSASSVDKTKYNMKVVLSDTCAKCLKCERGVRYLEKMSHPGAIGKGVPCILTRGKSYV